MHIVLFQLCSKSSSPTEIQHNAFASETAWSWSSPENQSEVILILAMGLVLCLVREPQPQNSKQLISEQGFLAIWSMVIMRKEQ